MGNQYGLCGMLPKKPLVWSFKEFSPSSEKKKSFMSLAKSNPMAPLNLLAGPPPLSKKNLLYVEVQKFCVSGMGGMGKELYEESHIVSGTLKHFVLQTF